jgi:hypothetical protein
VAEKLRCRKLTARPTIQVSGDVVFRSEHRDVWLSIWQLQYDSPAEAQVWDHDMKAPVLASMSLPDALSQMGRAASLLIAASRP